MGPTPKSESRLAMLQDAEAKRKRIDAHFAKVSGELNSIFRELQTDLLELEFQNEELHLSKNLLSEQHRRYFDLFENAPVAYLVLTVNGIVQDANPACGALLGIHRDQLTGRSFGRFVQPDAYDAFFHHLAQTSESGSTNSIELKLQINEETARHVLMATMPARAPDKTVRLYAVLIDVSENRRALEKLIASEEKYRLMFYEMASGAMIVDVIPREDKGNPADVVILDANPAFETLTGVPKEKVVGNRLTDIFPETENHWFEGLAETLRTGKPSSIETYHRQLGKYFLLTAFRSSQGIVITGMDVTERKKYEQNLRLAKDELEKKIEERTAELTASIQALQKQIEKREQAEKELKTVNKQLTDRADQLRRLTAELTRAEQRERRRLSKILHDGLQQHLASIHMRMGGVRNSLQSDELKAEMDDIGMMLDEAVQMARSLSVSLSPPVLHREGLAAGLRWLARWMQEKHHLNVDLVVEDECELPKDVLVMVFESVRELLFNTAKHAKVSKAQVRLQPIDGAGICLSVKDEGIGFDPDRLNADPGKEEGLGLFNIRDRITLLGGSFYIDSAPGQGSRFSLTIPCSGTSLE